MDHLILLRAPAFPSFEDPRLQKPALYQSSGPWRRTMLMGVCISSITEMGAGARTSNTPSPKRNKAAGQTSHPKVREMAQLWLLCWALELLARAHRVYSDENNFPPLMLSTWRPLGPSANNNTRAAWGLYLFPLELSDGSGRCWVHWAAGGTSPLLITHLRSAHSVTRGHGDGRQGLAMSGSCTCTNRHRQGVIWKPGSIGGAKPALPVRK